MSAGTVSAGTVSAGSEVEARRRGIVLAGSALSLALAAYLSARSAFVLERGTGWLALVLLIATLAVSPVTTLLGRTRARSWVPPLSRARRGLGLGSALVASVHVALSLASYFGGSPAWSAVMDAILTLPWLRHGLVAFSILALLALTSSKWIARRLRAWPALHRAIYLAAIVACFHAILGPHATGASAVALGVVVLLLVLRVLPHRGPPARERGAA